MESYKSYYKVSELTEGLFSRDKSVKIELPDGRIINFFADKDQIVSFFDPQSKEVKDFVEIQVVSLSDTVALIDLPQDTVHGQRFKVPLTSLIDLE